MRFLASRKSVRRFAWVALPLLLSLSASAFAAPAEEKEEGETSAKDKQQREAYLRAVPYPGGFKEESDLIRMHSLRMWYLMTYPTGKMPSSPWTRAQAHNQREVMDGEVWQEEGLVPPSGRNGGPRLMTGDAVIAPGTNT